jgi:AraC-like DNA-binding protein
MKLVEIRLPKEPDKSFIFYAENAPFASWHNHPEYELVLITKGWGKRSIGDHLGRFEPGDVILMGPYLPHEYICDEDCFTQPNGLQSECVVVQFDYTFLGQQFFNLPENKLLSKIMADSNFGCRFRGAAATSIGSIMMSMTVINDTDRLYALFSIFSLLTKTKEYELLSSPQFIQTFMSNENEVMKKVIQHLLQYFQQDIKVKDLLDIAHMSNTAFCSLFKKTYRMTFKEYLVKIRIGYACRLMIENTKSIGEIASLSGFENISNFNRQFRKIKNITPSAYISMRTNDLIKL